MLKFKIDSFNKIKKLTNFQRNVNRTVDISDTTVNFICLWHNFKMIIKTHIQMCVILYIYIFEFGCWTNFIKLFIYLFFLLILSTTQIYLHCISKTNIEYWKRLFRVCKSIEIVELWVYLKQIHIRYCCIRSFFLLYCIRL